MQVKPYASQISKLRTDVKANPDIMFTTNPLDYLNLPAADREYAQQQMDQMHAALNQYAKSEYGVPMEDRTRNFLANMLIYSLLVAI